MVGPLCASFGCVNAEQLTKYMAYILLDILFAQAHPPPTPPPPQRPRTYDFYYQKAKCFNLNLILIETWQEQDFLLQPGSKCKTQITCHRGREN